MTPRFLPILLLAACTVSAHTQSPAALPAAPSSAAPAKPSLTLTHALPIQAPPSTPDVAETCYAPATGIYAHQPGGTIEQVKAIDAYTSIMHQRVITMWEHNMPRIARDPWYNKAFVTIRFAILPSGEIDPPLVTASSGRSSYDHAALEAIRQASPFDPVPANIKHPLIMCFNFGYHVDDTFGRPKPKDPLPYPTGTPNN